MFNQTLLSLIKCLGVLILTKKPYKIFSHLNDSQTFENLVCARLDPGDARSKQEGGNKQYLW